MTAYPQKCCGFPLMMGSIQSGDLIEGSTTQSKLSESEWAAAVVRPSSLFYLVLQLWPSQTCV